MSHKLSIDLLSSVGACLPNCIILREIYPDGEIRFETSEYQTLRDKNVNIMWAVMLLTDAVKIELALSWYDRAIGAESVTWKDALRALVGAPETSGSSAQLNLRLEDRRNATAELDVSLAGVGYAAAAFALKMSQQPVEPLRVFGAMTVLVQWCARHVAAVEVVDEAGIADSFIAEVWAKLVEHGPISLDGFVA